MIKVQVGLTLIELLVSIAVMAVLLAIAVPSFQTLRQQYTVRSAGMAIYSDLQLARSESIKRNSAVTVCFTGTGTLNWSYQLRDSADCSGDILEATNAQNFPSVVLTSSYGGNLLTFRPRRNTLTSGNVTLSNGSQEMKVMTWNNSIIRTCSDDDLIGVPGC